MHPLQGKVRDVYELEDRLVIVTTDRQSAFDRLLASVPFKVSSTDLHVRTWRAPSLCHWPTPCRARHGPTTAPLLDERIRAHHEGQPEGGRGTLPQQPSLCSHVRGDPDVHF